VTLQYVRITIKDTDDLTLKQKLRLSPLLLKNFRAVMRAVKKFQKLPTGELQLEFMKGFTRAFDPLFESDRFKEGYQVFDRYDRSPGDVTWVFVADWTAEEVGKFVSDIKEVGTDLGQKMFTQAGIDLPAKALRDILNLLTEVEVHKAIPIRRGFQAQLDASMRVAAREAHAKIAA
jgi:hypothetical protein